MIVSTKGRYALRVMIDLAEHRDKERTPLKEKAAQAIRFAVPNEKSAVRKRRSKLLAYALMGRADDRFRSVFRPAGW